MRLSSATWRHPNWAAHDDLADVPVALVPPSISFTVVDDRSDCGIERWWTNGSSGEYLLCGLMDANGDGLLDCVYNDRFEDANGLWHEGAYWAQLGDGDGIDAGIEVKLPGPPTRIWNTHHDDCEVVGSPTAEVFHERNLVDLNGDGLPDYVSQDENEFGVPEPGGAWRVKFGKGLRFTGKRLIESPDKGFAVSSSAEDCSSDYNPKTRAGLVDVDGDGHVEIVRADGTGVFKVSRLQDATGAAGALDAGRLTQVDNGYGAAMRYVRASAKTDPSMPHQLPFPEVVVARVETTLSNGGSPVAPIHHAFGGARLRYQPLLARWGFTGYSRHVTLRGVPVGRSRGHGHDRRLPVRPDRVLAVCAGGQAARRLRTRHRPGPDLRGRAGRSPPRDLRL